MENVTARPLLGAPVAARIDTETAKKSAALLNAGIQVKLAVLYVGTNPDDTSYRHEISKQAPTVGVAVQEIGLPDEITADGLKTALTDLNNDATVHGVLIQTIKNEMLREAIRFHLSNDKDPEGVTPRHMGTLLQGKPEVLTCTPAAIMTLIKEVLPNLTGKLVAIINSSPVIGRPLALMLIAENATPILCNRYTGAPSEKEPGDLRPITRMADVIVTATGKQNLIGADHVRAGQIIIDASIIRLGNHHITGDVDYDAVKNIVAAITPVPNGVGPVTTATLLANTVELARIHQGNVRTYA